MISYNAFSLIALLCGALAQIAVARGFRALVRAQSRKSSSIFRKLIVHLAAVLVLFLIPIGWAFLAVISVEYLFELEEYLAPISLDGAGLLLLWFLGSLLLIDLWIRASSYSNRMKGSVAADTPQI